MANVKENEQHIGGFGGHIYVFIWIALLVLTGVTVTASVLRLGTLSVLTALMVASIKAAIVIWFFMNIAKEPPVFRLMLGVAVATLAVIIGFTFFDVSFR